MSEGQVTVDGTTHRLPQPFFVIATQNPVEQEGTFPLPEAQKDRFIIKTSLGYPDEEEEIEILNRRADRTNTTPSAERVCRDGEPASLRETVERIHVDPDVRRYIARLARATRDDGRVRTGVSPRATQRLFEAARALAAINGRMYVTPDEVKAVAPVVLSHRVVLTADARVGNIEKPAVVEDLLDELEVPTVQYTSQQQSAD
jgi:MoxR-like ATPase